MKVLVNSAVITSDEIVTTSEITPINFNGKKLHIKWISHYSHALISNLLIVTVSNHCY